MKSERYSIRQEKLRSLLKDYRRNTGLTQEGIAKALDAPQSFVSKYESGERLLNFVEVQRICEALGVPFLELVKQFQKETDGAE